MPGPPPSRRKKPPSPRGARQIMFPPKAATHWSPLEHSVDEAQSWKLPRPMQDAAHAMVPPVLLKLPQHTAPGVVQSCALAQDWVMPGKPASKEVVASIPPELVPELDPELEFDPELEPPPELLEFRPPASSGVDVPLEVEPPHAAANAATQLPTKRSLSI